MSKWGALGLTLGVLWLGGLLVMFVLISPANETRQLAPQVAAPQPIQIPAPIKQPEIVEVQVTPEVQTPPQPSQEDLVRDRAKAQAYEALQVLFPVPNLEITDVQMTAHDSDFDEANSPRYPLVATISIRFRDHDGYRKRFAAFACDNSGNILFKLSIPEP